MEQHFTIRQEAELDQVADFLEDKLHEGDVVCFHGPMGVGKTTLIKVLCRAFGVTDGLSSPSFGLVNEYETAAGDTIFHFDLYRLNDPDELLDIGWYDYLDQQQLVFVEWPEKAKEHIPDDALHIFMEPLPDGREIRITY